MPIYEFYCSGCYVIFQFFSKRIRSGEAPACPKCGREGLERKPSTFASRRKGGGEPAAEGGEPPVDEAKMMEAMASLEGEMSGLDENDPRQMARFMRRFSELTGVREPGMEEAIRRMESGEDPEKIEEEMGDMFGDGEMPEEGAAAGTPEPPKGLRRRFLPPARDEKLHAWD